MRKTYDGTQYQYRKVRDLPSVRSGFGMGWEQRALLRVEYRTKAEPETVRVCHVVKTSSHSFGQIHRWYYVSDENGDDMAARISGSTVGEAAESAEKLRKERESASDD